MPLKSYMPNGSSHRRFRNMAILAAAAISLAAGACSSSELHQGPDFVAPPSNDVRSCKASSVRVTIQYPSGVPKLIDATLVEQAPPPAQSGELQVVDVSGNVVAAAAVPHPLALSVIAPPGEAQGDQAVENTNGHVTVVLAWPSGSHAIRLGQDTIESPACEAKLGKADLSRIEAERIWGDGPSAQRFDIVILGDGYVTDADMARFKARRIP